MHLYYFPGELFGPMMQYSSSNVLSSFILPYDKKCASYIHPTQMYSIIFFTLITRASRLEIFCSDLLLLLDKNTWWNLISSYLSVSLIIQMHLWRHVRIAPNAIILCVSKLFLLLFFFFFLFLRRFYFTIWISSDQETRHSITLRTFTIQEPLVTIHGHRISISRFMLQVFRSRVPLLFLFENSS